MKCPEFKIDDKVLVFDHLKYIDDITTPLSLTKREPDYYERWIITLMSKLSLTEVKRIPGYVEMVKNNYEFWKTVE